jgi:SsrA-binding protein
MAQQLNIQNRKARFEFELLDTYVAGIQLTGSEIKSIRAGKASISEAYCFFRKEELFLKNAHIEEYKQGGYSNHDPKRDRKLLLRAGELVKLKKQMETQGLTIVPLRVFIADTGYAKLELALARGKKLHDKRDSIKDKDVQRDIDRAMKR